MATGLVADPGEDGAFDFDEGELEDGAEVPVQPTRTVAEQAAIMSEPRLRNDNMRRSYPDKAHDNGGVQQS